MATGGLIQPFRISNLRLVAFFASTLLLWPCLSASEAVPSSDTKPAAVGEGNGNGVYLDGLLRGYDATKHNKKSNTAVIYMCSDKAQIVRSLPALLNNSQASDCDVIISQAGADTSANFPVSLEGKTSLVLRHPANLSVGEHQYFVNAFAFDTLGYESLVVVEEEVLLHPDALTMLLGMLKMSAADASIGLVSINDLDNSLFLNENKYSAAVLNVSLDTGHLWAYAMHASRYREVKQDLLDYYNVIKGRDYGAISEAPLRDVLISLLKAKGMHTDIPLALDSYLIHRLTAAGFSRRLTTLLRFLAPVSLHRLHLHRGEDAFFRIFGRGMMQARVGSAPPYVVTPGSAAAQDMQVFCKERLGKVYKHYLGREADEGAVRDALAGLLSNHLNGVELVHNILNSEEHDRHLKTVLNRG